GTLHADLRPLPLTRLRERGIPVHDSLEQAVRCFQALADFSAVTRRDPPPQPFTEQQVPAALNDVVTTCRRERRVFVLEHEARRILAQAGVTMPPAPLVHSAAEAASAFNGLGGIPVAMKIVSRDIMHKSDVGGVELGVSSAAMARQSFDRVVANGHRAVANADVLGIL